MKGWQKTPQTVESIEFQPVQFDETFLDNPKLSLNKETYLFTEFRRHTEDYPQNYPFVYHLRHDDNGDWVTPVSISPRRILVNFCGTLFSKTDLNITDEIPFDAQLDYL